MNNGMIPVDPLSFIRDCVQSHSVVWTYHVNMRMKERFIDRTMIMQSTGTYEIIESYPHDRYLPSYLVRASCDDCVFHILFAVDIQNTNVRIITAYYPDQESWIDDFKRRKKP